MTIGIKKNMVFLTGIVLVSFMCSGCATMRHPVPKDLVTKAQIDDMSEIRVVSGVLDSPLQESLVASVKDERAGEFPVGPDGVKIYPVLAVSGGAANGAYGAGLLKGWSAEGSRPVFKVVTGVSTGAIIAPFAFLGKDYDAELEKYYTTMSTKDVMSPKGPFAVLFGDSLASSRPLAKMIERVADEELLAKIAEEHKHGRRLLVGTVNLDAQKFVVWDMGAIAVRGDAELFRKVILASASIPVTFPPVYFKVNADGKEYDEMHVDGGTVTQVFSTYKLLEHMGKVAKSDGIDPSKVRSKLYIIRNGYMSANYMKVKDELAPIAGRAIDTIVDAQAVGDVYRMYVYMKHRENDYNLAFIPPDFAPEGKEMFDPIEMRRLFDRGYNDAVKGYPWHKTPPGVEVPDKPAK